MAAEVEAADLVLVLGTSLSGQTAVEVAKTAAANAVRGVALGTVILNLQQTPHDGIASLRLFGFSDDILARIVRLLAVSVPRSPIVWPAVRALVPYDDRGRRTAGPRMLLDLSVGQRVRITDGHNLYGAGRPEHVEGHVLRRSDAESAIIIDIEGAEVMLGLWWVAAATRGAVKHLPVVNSAPLFDDGAEEASPSRSSPARSPQR